jgi:hypothetical protein
MSYDCLTPEQQAIVDVLMMQRGKRDRFAIMPSKKEHIRKLAEIFPCKERTMKNNLAKIYQKYGIGTDRNAPFLPMIRLVCLRARELGLLAVCLSVLCAIGYGQAANGFVKIASGVTATKYTDASCPDQVTCYYEVTAVDSAGFESGPSTCLSTSPCIANVELIVGMPVSGTHTVALTWVASNSTGVSYNVYQHVGPFPASNLGGTVN